MNEGYTIAQAKLMFCPMALSGGRTNLCCRASSCMAWRWYDAEWETVECKREFVEWEPTSSSSRQQVYRDGPLVQTYLDQGFEPYWPEWMKKYSNPPYTEPEKYVSSRYLRRRIPESERKGYCGISEPRIVEVEHS